jgi:hypothetical protein
MAAIAIQGIVKSPAAAPTFAAANAGGDTVNPAADFLVVKASGSACNVTITPTGTTSYGVALPALVVAVTGAQERWINLNDPSFVNGSGVIAVTYSQVTGVTVGAFAV